MLYTETVTRYLPVTREETIEVPEELVRLVNSNDSRYGKNGTLYLGCDQAKQGGRTIDRLRWYLSQHTIYYVQHGHPCNCPISPVPVADARNAPGCLTPIAPIAECQ